MTRLQSKFNIFTEEELLTTVCKMKKTDHYDWPHLDNIEAWCNLVDDLDVFIKEEKAQEKIELSETGTTKDEK